MYTSVELAWVLSLALASTVSSQTNTPVSTNAPIRSLSPTWSADFKRMDMECIVNIPDKGGNLQDLQTAIRQCHIQSYDRITNMNANAPEYQQMRAHLTVLMNRERDYQARQNQCPNNNMNSWNPNGGFWGGPRVSLSRCRYLLSTCVENAKTYPTSRDQFYQVSLCLSRSYECKVQMISQGLSNVNPIRLGRMDRMARKKADSFARLALAFGRGKQTCQANNPLCVFNVGCGGDAKLYSWYNIPQGFSFNQPALNQPVINQPVSGSPTPLSPVIDPSGANVPGANGATTLVITTSPANTMYDQNGNPIPQPVPVSASNGMNQPPAMMQPQRFFLTNSTNTTTTPQPQNATTPNPSVGTASNYYMRVDGTTGHKLDCQRSGSSLSCKRGSSSNAVPIPSSCPGTALFASETGNSCSELQCKSVPKNFNEYTCTV